MTTSYRDRFFPLSARVELGRTTARHFAGTAANHTAAAARLDAKGEPLAARNQRAHARQAVLTGALHAITAVAAATAHEK